jgi:ACS family hexuronate transporter-like MFS transporter
MMLVSLISYVDRNALALLAPTILHELHLSGREYGFIIAAFSVAYSIGNPVWGWLIDRIGLRRGMLVAVTLWSVASASHALAATFIGLAIARALLGFGEGASFPGGLRAAQRLPRESRARGIALAYSGGSLGAILTPIIVTPVALAYGWRAAFLCTGLLGAAWLVLWIVVSRGEIRAVANAAPRESGADGADGTERVRVNAPRLWAFIAAYALGGLPLGFVLYGSPLYLHRALHRSQADLGALLWLPPVGWEIGYFFWGFVIDRATRGTADATPRFRKLLACLTLMTLPLAATPALPGVAMPLAAFALATFVAAGFVMVGLAYAARVFSARDAGLVAGIGAGSWSAGLAVLMPVFGWLFDRGDYRAAFALATAAPLLGFAVWSALSTAHRTKSIRS